MGEAKHSVRFPGENAAYRAARNSLLDDEIQLRRNIEEVTITTITLNLPRMISGGRSTFLSGATSRFITSTDAGRYLFAVVIRFPDGKGYTVTARTMTDKEERQYRRWKER